MMGLPHLFRVGGIVPVITAIVAIFFGSSFTGTLLSDAIASIPGNKEYNRNVRYVTLHYVTWQLLGRVG
jgi:amino acid permease